MNPQQLLLENQEFLARLTRLCCQRKGLSAEQSEDFTQMVNVKLLENDYRVIRQFRGKSKLTSYLAVVIQRYLLDYLNHLWGKWRPSRAAQRLGPLAIRLERLTVRDGLTLEEAVQTLITSEKVQATEAELEELAVKLPRRFKRRIEADDQLERIAVDDAGAETLVQQREWSADGERIRGAVAEVLATFPAEDAMIVKLHSRMGVAQIARSLSLEQKPLYRRRDQLMATVRKQLEELGIERQQVIQYLTLAEDYR